MDEYQTPALGRVRRPGSTQLEDLPGGAAAEEEEEEPGYFDEVDVEA